VTLTRRMPDAEAELFAPLAAKIARSFANARADLALQRLGRKWRMPWLMPLGWASGCPEGSHGLLAYRFSIFLNRGTSSFITDQAKM